MEDEIVICPGCGSNNGPESLLGRLGRLQHYRCRYCGIGHYFDVVERERDQMQARIDAAALRGEDGDSCN